jgi:hypothetical protein
MVSFIRTRKTIIKSISVQVDSFPIPVLGFAVGFLLGLIYYSGFVTGYGLDDRMIGVRFLAGAGNFSLRHRVQNGSGAHSASYPMGTEVSFHVGKAAGACR